MNTYFVIAHLKDYLLKEIADAYCKTMDPDSHNMDYYNAIERLNTLRSVLMELNQYEVSAVLGTGKES